MLFEVTLFEIFDQSIFRSSLDASPTVIRINSSFDSDGWTAGSCRKLATAAVVFIGDRSINIYIWRPISEISERPETLHVLLDNCLETIKQLPVHYFTISRFENLGRVFWKKKKKN